MRRWTWLVAGGFVFVAAFASEPGESVGELTGKFPAVATAWTAARPTDVPLALFGKQMDPDVHALTDAVTARDADTARDAGPRVARTRSTCVPATNPMPTTRV